MPSVPKWFADTLEKVTSKHYHPVTVTHTMYYTPELKLVRFEGEINSAVFVPANVVEFRVSDTEYRHYTPSLYDAESQVCEVIFYLHGKGIGSRWAENLKKGDSMKLMGPGGRMSYQPGFDRHFVFGDETSLGLMRCMANAAQQYDHAFFGLTELEEEHVDWVRYLDIRDVMTTGSSMANPAQPAIELIDRWEGPFWEKISTTCFYLTGRARSIQQLRQFLLLKGVGSRQIKTYPYWAEGKKGL